MERYTAQIELSATTNDPRVRIEVPCSYDTRLPVRVARWLDLQEAEAFASDILRAVEAGRDALL